MKESWLHSSCLEQESFKQSVNFVTISVLNDITHDLKVFNSFKDCWQSTAMKSKLNKYYFPTVKCPVGCWEVIDYCGKISFKHFLSYIIPSFDSFDADCSLNLAGIRKDCFNIEKLFRDDPKCPATQMSVFVDNGNLFLATCRYHSNKIGDQYIHVPKSPHHRQATNSTDRFAPATITNRTLKPFRENFSQCSYKMYQLDSSFKGTSTCTISESRTFDRIDEDSQKNELLYLKNRPDTLRVMQQLQEDNEISSSFATGLQTMLKNFNMDVRNDLANANFVPLESATFMKKFLNQVQPNVTFDKEAGDSNQALGSVTVNSTNLPGQETVSPHADQSSTDDNDGRKIERVPYISLDGYVTGNSRQSTVNRLCILP